MKRHIGLIKLVGTGVGALKLVKPCWRILKKSFVWRAAIAGKVKLQPHFRHTFSTPLQTMGSNNIPLSHIRSGPPSDISSRNELAVSHSSFIFFEFALATASGSPLSAYDALLSRRQDGELVGKPSEKP